MKRFTQAGRIGTYLRVIKTGTISAGDHIHRTFVPKHGITVGQWFSEPSPELVQILLDAEADGEIRLQEDYRPVFEKVMRRNGLQGL
ncbi:hypothetical protein D3C73_1207810 [compost metagenome]